MKFGKSIGSQQEGNADLHYVEYKLLKKRIKDVVAGQQSGELAEALTANTAFEEELAAEIKQVNGCFVGRQQELLDRTGGLSDELLGDWGAATAVGARRPDSLRRLVDILGEIDQLRKYAVWNAVAVVKILKKRRKQTNFGIEDSAAERSGWLSRHTFFSGSDFAELHVAIESLGHTLVRSQCSEMSVPGGGDERGLCEQLDRSEQCPICLGPLVDVVELSCSHRFCWKCFVLGPIAFQPGEYRITQCPICRKETTEPLQDLEADGEGAPPHTSSSLCRPESGLTRFLHTYFPQEPARQFEGDDGDTSPADEDVRDVVSQLVKALLEGRQAVEELPQPAASSSSRQEAAAVAPAQGASSSSGPSDFFLTLPQGPSGPERAALNQAQKLHWLQVASTGDPLALDGAMYCSLCSEPLVMDAVVTTPCKHHFHRHCVGRLERPQCPLCSAALPFSWFLPGDHPCVEHGFKVVLACDYRPRFAGGPSRGNCGWPLHRPPPMSLHGPDGIVMKSYLHRGVPLGLEEEPEEDSDSSHSHPTPWAEAPPAGQLADEGDGASESGSSSSDESGSDDGADPDPGGPDAGGRGGARCAGGPRPWLCSALGRMRLCEAGEGAEEQRNPVVLLIGSHV